jgi:hypothetical protein
MKYYNTRTNSRIPLRFIQATHLTYPNNFCNQRGQIRLIVNIDVKHGNPYVILEHGYPFPTHPDNF